MDTHSKNFQRIQRISRIIQRLLLLAMGVVLLSGVGYWLLQSMLPAAYQPGALLKLRIVGPIPTAALVLAAFISIPGVAIGVGVLEYLHRLFKLYEAGQIFEQENVRCFHWIGRLLVVGGIYRLLAHPLLGVVLTWHNPPGQKQLALMFGSGDLFSILTGAIVIVIAWVMAEARDLQTEQRLTI